MTALDVYFHADRIGRLERLRHARLGFAYEPSWVSGGGTPLSLSLPLREEVFVDEECRPFFAGLLPEGDFLKAVARAFHISAENPFTVLGEIGGECAGAVSLVPPDVEPPFLTAPPPRWLDEGGLATLLRELPNRPLLVGSGDEDEGVRLSLAGTRDKLPVLVDGDRLGVTRGRPPSTHIVKDPIPDVAGMVANEAFCLALARESGLSAALATPIAADGLEGLLVERYDRDQSLAGPVRRIHQEDFCQALGFLSAEKYEAEGGPGVAVCGELIRRHFSSPAVDLLDFLDALLFNLLIGNADAHSKNYSFLMEGDRAPRLAPLYDLLSTRAYGRPLGRKMAMKYGGEYRPDRIRGRHLDRMAGDLEMTPRTVRAHAQDITERALAATGDARLGLPELWQDDGVLEKIEDVLGSSAEALRRAAGETD